MYGYDISNWQKGMNVSNTLHDFGIFKATEGASYVDPTFTGFMKQTSKYRGAYHYLKSTGPVENEVQNFVKAVKPYIGKLILAVDVEDSKLYNAGGVERIRVFLNRLKELTGVTGFVYTSLSWENHINWGSIPHYYPLWVAQYNDNRSRSYNAPALLGHLVHWTNWAIHQYTSHGRINGYSGPLDLNVSQGDWRNWIVWCKSSKSTSKPQTSKPQVVPKWVATKGRATLIVPVKLRKLPSVKATTIAVLSAGSVIKYDAAIILNGYRWVRQPRGNGHAYLATGPASSTLAYVKR